MGQLLELRERIRPYVGDTVAFVHQALKEGKTILLITHDPSVAASAQRVCTMSDGRLSGPEQV